MAVTGSPTGGNDVLAGDNANDLIKALSGNDRMSGGGGRDTAWGEAGNDDFDGGSGTDIAAYKDVFTDFTISVVNGVTQVKHRDNQETTWDGNDKLTNVERLQFADRIVLLANDLGPVANGDTASTAEDAALVFDGTPGKNLLSNDTDADGDALKVTWVGDVSTDAKGAVGIVTVSNGVVTFTPRQDFSGTATFAYQVTDQIGAVQDYNGNAIDLPVYQNGQQVGGTTSGKATVTVNVTPVNDAPTTPTDTDAAANSVAENSAAGAPVGITARATDVDTGDTLTYHLGQGAQTDGRFAVDANTGVVTTARALDYETDGASLGLTVWAKDATGAEISTAFSVAVTNVQEGSSGAPAVSGTAKQGQVLTAAIGTLADPDGINGLIYQWEALRGGDWTTIKDASGANVTGTTYTLTAADVGAAVRSVAVYTDGVGASMRVASAQTDAVIPLNRAPGLPADANAVTNSVLESHGPGADTGLRVSATDPDGETPTYHFKSGDNFVQNDGRFAVDAATGAVTVFALGQLDFEAAASHTVTLWAKDAAGLATSADFTVAVANVQEGWSGAPVITKTVTTNPKPGDVLTVAQGSLSDPDGISSLTYRWQSQEGGQWNDIAGANGTSYTLTTGESGETVRAIATLTDGLAAVADVASNTFAVAALAPPVNGFMGKTVQLGYYFGSVPWAPLGYVAGTNVVGDGVEFPNGNGPIYTVDLNNTQIIIDYTGSVWWTNNDGGYNGPIVRDTFSQVSEIVGANLSSNNMTGLDASRVSYDANSIYVNWEGLQATADTRIVIDVLFA
jgi:hypothetical protein